MRRVTSRAPISFQRSVFVRERTLLVGVALNASCIRAGGEPGLLEFKTAMRIVTVTALHGPFKDLVVERLVKIRLHLIMTIHAELGFAHFQQPDRRKARLLSVRFADEPVRTGHVLPVVGGMSRVAIRTAYVVAPVLSAAEVVVFLSAGVAAKTCFGDFFGGLVFERNDLCRVAFLTVSLAGTMTSFATSHLSFPAAYARELGMRGMREGFKLIFVTVLACIATDVTGVAGRYAHRNWFLLGLANSLRRSG